MHLIYQVVAKLGPKFNPDDAMKVMSEMKFDSPRGPIMIDPKTRDIVQNVYLRRVKEQGGTARERELPHGADGQGPVEGGESVSCAVSRDARVICMTSAIVILLDGIAYGMVLFIISVGLTVTMGLMRVVNLAHGGFAMAGGYLAAVMVVAGVPFILARDRGDRGCGLARRAMRDHVFRPLYRKGELAQVLMTFGLTFVMIAALTAMFGTDIKRLPVPDCARAAWSISASAPIRPIGCS